MKEKTVCIRYRFKVRRAEPMEIAVTLRYPSLELISHRPKELPEWTQLKHHPCENCPLDPAEHAHCPVAANLAEVVQQFADRASFETGFVTVQTDARTYSQELPLQNAVGSLMGLYMVTSGCPIMDKLRPMVYTHLPFATIQETAYRAASMYLLAQYLIAKQGGEPDWQLSNLVRIYEAVRTVNRGFTKRLTSAQTKDASPNALFSLDCQANYLVFSLEETTLEELREVFHAYLQPQAGP